MRIPTWMTVGAEVINGGLLTWKKQENELLF
jgi:hypothetical protein